MYKPKDPYVKYHSTVLCTLQDSYLTPVSLLSTIDSEIKCDICFFVLSVRHDVYGIIVMSL
jgi:hypothetical protein